MKLISMTDFVLQEKEKLREKLLSEPYDRNDLPKSYDRICNYTEFLRQPLTLGMFVPVNKQGVILEPLQFCCTATECGCMGMPVNVSSHEEINEYYEAEEKVLFSGVKIIHKENYFLIEDVNGYWLRIVKKKTLTTVEDLLKLSGVKLTPSALKKIGL